MRTALLFVACGLGLCAAVACGSTVRTPTDWRIVLNHRIGAVSLGESQERVEATLGHGEEKQLDNYSRGFIFYPSADLYVVYFKYGGEQRAYAIVTKSPRYKTPSGVGVGSSVDDLRRGVSVDCGAVGSPPPSGECQTTGESTDRLVTQFNIDAATKRITEVLIFPGH